MSNADCGLAATLSQRCHATAGLMPRCSHDVECRLRARKKRLFTRLHAEAADCGLAATLSLSLPFSLPLPLIVATAMDRATLPRGATGKWGTFIYLTLSLYIYIYIYRPHRLPPHQRYLARRFYYICLLYVFLICLYYMYPAAPVCRRCCWRCCGRCRCRCWVLHWFSWPLTPAAPPWFWPLSISAALVLTFWPLTPAHWFCPCPCPSCPYACLCR